MAGAADWEPGKVGDAAMRRWSAEVYAPDPEPPWCPVGNIVHHDVMTCTLPACREWAAGQRKRDAEDEHARAEEREIEFMIDMRRNERED